MMKKKKGILCVKIISSCLLITFFIIVVTATFVAAANDCEKIEICHKPDEITIILEVETGVNGTDICVDEDAYDDHLAHGDTEGPCVTSPAS